jgi:pSer/pThr/pTyr-binding forkhead associated (FHA) protein
MTSIATTPVGKLMCVNTRQLILVGDDSITIGRAPGNDITLTGMPLVSRYHARVFGHNGEVYLEDLGSTNGTFVNDKKIPGIVQLQDLDRIGIGGYFWYFRSMTESADITRQLGSPRDRDTVTV